MSSECFFFAIRFRLVDEPSRSSFLLHFLSHLVAARHISDALSIPLPSGALHMASWDLREICTLHLKREKSVLIPCKLLAAVWCVDCYDNFLCAEIFSAAELTKIACAYSRVDSRATLLWYELCEILTKLVTLHLSTLVGQFEMRI